MLFCLFFFGGGGREGEGKKWRARKNKTMEKGNGKKGKRVLKNVLFNHEHFKHLKANCVF